MSAHLNYGTLEPEELDAAVRLYLDAFPARVATLFTHERHALCFFHDLFELMRRRWPTGFLAARRDGLVGFVVLTRGNTLVPAGPAARRFALRMAARAGSGRYGSPFRLLKRILVATSDTASARLLKEDPHVYAIAVDAKATGAGIGTGLLEAARHVCRDDARIWLRVEPENAGAIRFYERSGFRCVEKAEREHIMVRDLRTEAA